MSLPEDDQNKPASILESKPAIIAAIAVIVVGIVAAGYFGYSEYRAHHARVEAALVHTTVVPKIDPKALRNIEIAVCSAEVDRAKEIGMVPSYGALASPNLVNSGVPGRFICEAQTHLTHYFISADFRCNKLSVAIRDPRCISVYRVMLKDGTLIYSRP